MFPAINESNHMSTKYCINCKHFSPKEGDTEHEFARCSYKQSPSLVTGTLVRESMRYCHSLRASTTLGNCGAAGNHYEEKEATNV